MTRDKRAEMALSDFHASNETLALYVRIIYTFTVLYHMQRSQGPYKVSYFNIDSYLFHSFF